MSIINNGLVLYIYPSKKTYDLHSGHIIYFFRELSSLNVLAARLFFVHVNILTSACVCVCVCGTLSRALSVHWAGKNPQPAA